MREPQKGPKASLAHITNPPLPGKVVANSAVRSASGMLQMKGKICGWWGRERKESCGRRTFVFFFILLFIGIIFLVESTTWFDQLTTKSKGWGLERWVSNLMVFGSKYRSQRCAESTPSGFLRLRFWQLSKLLCFTNCKSLSLSFSLHFPYLLNVLPLCVFFIFFFSNLPVSHKVK